MQLRNIIIITYYGLRFNLIVTSPELFSDSFHTDRMCQDLRMMCAALPAG